MAEKASVIQWSINKIRFNLNTIHRYRKINYGIEVLRMAIEEPLKLQ